MAFAIRRETPTMTEIIMNRFPKSIPNRSAGSGTIICRAESSEVSEVEQDQSLLLPQLAGLALEQFGDR
jgi:hypothetical protein